MVSINPPLTKEDFINSGWKEVIDSSERKECRSYYYSGFESKERKAQADGKEKEYKIFNILKSISDIQTMPEIKEESLVLSVQHFTNEHLEFLAEIVDQVSDPELQARITDILWTSKKPNSKNSYKMAQLAVEAYLKSAKELEDIEQWFFYFARIKRGLYLARKINYKTEEDKIIDYVEKVLDKCNGEDTKSLSAKLMELLLEYKFGEPKKYAALSEKAATLAEKRHHWHRARNYWEIKAKWHRIEKQPEQEIAAQMQSAETYVKEAEDAIQRRNPPSYSAASDFIRKAIEAFSLVKGTKEETRLAKERCETLHKILRDYQQESRQEGTTVNQYLYIESQEIEYAKSLVQGKSLQDALFSLASLAVPRPISYLREDIQNEALYYPASHLFPKKKENENGQVIAHRSSYVLSSNQDEAEDAIRYEMYAKAIEYQISLVLSRIEPARKQINLEHNITANDLRSIILNSPFVPSGRDDLFTKGFYAGLTGDFFTSTHILIPQIENSVRYLLRKQGALPSKIDIKKGIEDERDLNTTLFERNYQEIRLIFDEDTLFDLQGLLIERSGSNLRNRMAHGLINDDGFSSPIMSYLWWVTLRLCFGLGMLIPQQKPEEFNPWLEFDGIFKDDPLFDDFVENMAANRRELDAEMSADEDSVEENQSA